MRTTFEFSYAVVRLQIKNHYLVVLHRCLVSCVHFALVASPNDVNLCGNNLKSSLTRLDVRVVLLRLMTNNALLSSCVKIVLLMVLWS